MRKTVIEKMVVALVFLAILIVGLCVFDDYGIGIDEQRQRQHSLISYREMNRVLLGRDIYSNIPSVTGVGTVPELSEYRDKYYGVAMQLPLVFAEDCYKHLTGNEMGYRQIYLMRHLYTFLVYYVALVCFYFLLKHLFDNRWLAIAGVLMVFLFGRFFSQSFYNIKDMLFASLMMIALCCAERVFATDRKPLWCLLFALSGALLVTSRIVGALLLVLVLLAMLLQDVLAARRAKRAGIARQSGTLIKKLLPYLLICCAYPIWIAATPAAWSDPIGFSLGYVSRFSDYTAWSGDVVFAGKVLDVNASAPPPRGFLITWIVLTVPIVNQLLCLLGIGVLIGRTVTRKRTAPALSESGGVMLWLMLSVIVGTIGYQVIFRPIVYNDWRHAFYLYPMMIALAVYGLWWIFMEARIHARRWLAVGAGCLLACSLACNAYRIASNHPYQHCLYNTVGRRYAAGFERDYWEITYRSMAEWLVENREGVLRCHYEDTSGLGELRFYMLANGFERLDFRPLEETDYILWVVHDAADNERSIAGFTEIHPIVVDGVRIAAVYERIAE